MSQYQKRRGTIKDGNFWDKAHGNIYIPLYILMFSKKLNTPFPCASVVSRDGPPSPNLLTKYFSKVQLTR